MLVDNGQDGWMQLVDTGLAVVEVVAVEKVEGMGRERQTGQMKGVWK